MEERTIGQVRMRTSFNPSEDPKVDEIKQKCADLIDLISSIQAKDLRLAQIAMDGIEIAGGVAVKLATA